MSQFSYEPRGPLDAPELAVSMALDGELTTRGLRLAAFDPAGLSPSERETYATRMKHRTGNHPLTNALTDIALNPLTWFYFATSPAGMGALGTTSKLLFQPSKKLAGFLAENGTFLQRMGLTTGLQATSEGSAGSVLNSVARFVQGRREQELQVVGPAHEAMTQANGLKAGTINYRNIGNPEQKDKAYKLSVALDGYIRRIDQERTEFRPFISPESKKPPRIVGLTSEDNVQWQNMGTLPSGNGKAPKNSNVWIASITHAPTVSANMEEVVRALGGDEAVKYGIAAKQHLADVKKMTWGKDGEAGFVPDPDKLLRLWRAAQNPAFKNAPTNLQEGLGVMQTMMGPGLESVHALPFDKWKSLAETVGFQPLESEGYMPNNIFDYYKDGKSTLSPVNRTQLARLHPVSGAISRTHTSPSIHPDDLRTLETLAGPSDKLTELIGIADKTMRRSHQPGEGVRFLRMNPDASLQKHTLQMNGAAALSQAVFKEGGERVLLANQEAINKGLYKEDGIIPGTKPSFGRSAEGDDISMRLSINQHNSEGQQPLGGFSMADALAADMVHMRNKYTLNRISDIYLPRAMGMNPYVKSTVMADHLLSAKETTFNFSNSPIMKKIEAKGGIPAAMVARMREWGDSVNVPGEVGKATGGLTKYLYATHLWGNTGSALLNLSQPLSYTLNTYGLKHTSEGMWQAMNDLGTYAKLRSEQSWKYLNEIEAEEIKKKAFRISTSGPQGTDPIGIRTKVFDVLEGQLGGATSTKKASAYDRFIDAGMFMFQKTEWFNRLTTGYAHMSWAKEAGHLPADFNLGAKDLAGKLRGYSTAVGEASRANQEFQFASDVLNTPDIFQPGQMLGNPLLRQFAGFVTRSATVPFALSPQISGGARVFRGTNIQVPLPPGVTDFMRILGSSAVIYELGKNLIGSDLTRYTGFAQVTSAYPFINQGRIDASQDGLPVVPPIIDIPIQGIKSLVAGDMELFKRTAARTVIGGVAGLKFYKYGVPGIEGLYGQLGGKEGDVERESFGSQIDPKTGLPGTPTADYGNPRADGRVPYYNSDGTLIDYRSPTQLILQGLGFPVRDTEVPQLDRFLTRNAEEIASYRQDAIDKLLSGDSHGYEQIAAQFGKRFQFKGEDGQNRPLPLAISQGQIDARRKLQVQTRSDRIAGRFPADIRSQYSGIVETYDPNRSAQPDSAKPPSQQRSEQIFASEGSAKQDEKPFSTFGEFRGFKGP